MKVILFFIGLLFFIPVFSQKDVTTVGLQIKPIVPANYLNTGEQNQSLNGIDFTIAPQVGYSFGMVVRKGFTEQLSLETGINYTRRNYDLTIIDQENNFIGESDYRYIIYEVPLLGLVYIRLSEKAYMNVALGGALDLLPTNWQSYDDYFQHRSWRNSWIVTSLLANVGFEYRTRNKGYLYFGASFHRPFANITQAVVQYNYFDKKEIVGFDINGNYLTLDFRYFFHENPERRR